MPGSFGETKNTAILFFLFLHQTTSLKDIITNVFQNVKKNEFKQLE